jgi:N-acetylmuramoyl-L-alanine amidase
MQNFFCWKKSVLILLLTSKIIKSSSREKIAIWGKMSLVMNMLVASFIVLSQSLFCVDFHDFDIYQYKLTDAEIELRIKTYLEKDQTIQRFYHLTPQAFYIGDLDQQQVDYILYLNTAISISSDASKTSSGLKNKRIAIDPGHFGGKLAELEERYVAVPAEKTRNNQPILFHEGDLTYLTALELQRLLEAEGALVLVTRSGMGLGAIQEDFVEWMETHPELGKSGSSLPKIFRNYYNKEDLIERAKKINDFYPDITIVIHYNAHLTDQEKEEKTILTQSNYNLAFIPGSFCANELNATRDRYEFLRLIVTDDVDRSLKLSEHIVTQFVDKLNVPLIAEGEKTSYTDAVCLIQKPGIYCRNLALTRLVHGPICYGETLIQNNEDEVYRLSASDHSIAGNPCSKRIEEVAQAYFEGIKAYFVNTLQEGI